VPIYEYRCLECDERFETLVLNSEEDVACISCWGKKLEKQFSTFGIKSEGEFSKSDSSSSGCGCSAASCGCGVKN
jgi:putative FmdB family regulatory protein